MVMAIETYVEQHRPPHGGGPHEAVAVHGGVERRRQTGVALSIISESSHWQLCAQPQAAEPRASRTGPNPSPASMSSADAMERYVRSVTILTSSPEEVSDEQLLVSEAASRPPSSLSLNRPWQLRAAAEVHP
jgi:hypothetical protein